MVTNAILGRLRARQTPPLASVTTAGRTKPPAKLPAHVPAGAQSNDFWSGSCLGQRSSPSGSWTFAYVRQVLEKLYRDIRCGGSARWYCKSSVLRTVCRSWGPLE